MAIASGMAPKIMKTRRLPKRDLVLSVNQPKSGSLIASQIFADQQGIAGQCRQDQGAIGVELHQEELDR